MEDLTPQQIVEALDKYIVGQQAADSNAFLPGPQVAPVRSAAVGRDHAALGAAEYRLSHHCKSGRGVYTFCMCPGGKVIAAASEQGGLVTNGMSSFARDGANANSGLLVGVAG